MPPDVFGLKGKVALIVGGGQGIGESAGRYLAGAGCAVAVADVEPDRAHAVAAALAQARCRSLALTADVLLDADLERIVTETEAGLGGLDVVVAIVGKAKFGGVLELTHDEWDRDHARNLRYVFFLAQAAARSFIRRGVKGAFICLSTGGVANSMPFRSAYGAAKAGLSHMIRSLAVELGEHGVRVNAIAPGMTVTPRTAARMGSESTQAEVAKIPLGRLGTPDDIGKVALFLASDLAGHITGATIPVDGGSGIAPNYDLGPSRAASRRNRRSMGVEVGDRS